MPIILKLDNPKNTYRGFTKFTGYISFDQCRIPSNFVERQELLEKYRFWSINIDYNRLKPNLSTELPAAIMDIPSGWINTNAPFRSLSLAQRTLLVDKTTPKKNFHANNSNQTFYSVFHMFPHKSNVLQKIWEISIFIDYNQFPSILFDRNTNGHNWYSIGLNEYLCTVSFAIVRATNPVRGWVLIFIDTNRL